MSRRTERVGSLIRTIIAQAIQSRLHDPRIAPLTSVTRVEVSADWSVARVHISVLAPEAQQKLSVEALRHAAGRLRTMVAERITLRQAPRLDFLLDTSLKRAFETVQAIDQAMAELGERPAWEQEERAAEEPKEAAGAAGAGPEPEPPGDERDGGHSTRQEDG